MYRRRVDDLRTRNLQLRAIAGLGQSAIRARELAGLMDEAVAVAAEMLDARCGAVVEIAPDGEGLLLRAAIGLNEDAGRGPVSSLAELGLDGAARASIHDRTHPWGFLAFQARANASFSADDIEFLQSVANVLALAIERDAASAEERRKSEQLQMIFDEIPVMIAFWQGIHGPIYANRAWERTLGWTAEEARAIDILAELYSDSGEIRTVVEHMERCSREWVDVRPRTRSGRIIDTTWARFALSDGSSIDFGLDITERKEAERRLIESELRFSKVFQASPVALAISTVREGRVIDVNESWQETFGYRRDEVIGRTNAELAVAADPAERVEVIRQFRANGIVRNVEMHARRKSGEIRNLIVSAVPIVIAGEEELWLSAQVDITDRKRAEAERDQLLEREKAARTAAEATLDRLRAIESITDSALQHLGLDGLLQKLLARVRSALNADFASVALLDESRSQLYLRAVSGRAHPAARAIRSPLGEGVAGRVAADGKPRIVHDLASVDLTKIEGVTAEEILALSRSVIAAPLYAGGKIIGVVTAAAAVPNHFEDEDLKLLLVVADRVSPAVERARLVESVHAAGERSKALSARLLTAQEEERRRVAVELHDALGQILTAVKINLQSLERTLAAQPHDLARAIASVDDAMERVRDLALDLRPSVLDDLGLPAALRWYGDRFARDTWIDVQFSIDAVHGLAPEIETACFRVAQEALTNVARHAHARRVWVGLHTRDDETELTVQDDGVGFDAAAARERATSGISVGLLGMEERVTSLGGEFTVQSAPGEGTLVSARFPRTEKM